LSLRRPHIRRRSKPDGDAVAEFLGNVEIAAGHYGRDRILNVDETSWKLLNNRMITVAECGADGVACQFDADVKGCVTVTATIDANGMELPLWKQRPEHRIDSRTTSRATQNELPGNSRWFGCK
jgi:hypothetical protein